MPTKRRTRWATRNRRLFVIAAVVIIVLVLAGASLLRVGGGPSEPTEAGGGVQDDAISIGIRHGANQEALDSGDVPGDTDERKQAQALVDWANANGGMAGRTVQPNFSTFDWKNASPEAVQQGCSDFTQDPKVFAVVVGAPIDDGCLAEADVVAFGRKSGSAQSYQESPDYLYGPSDFNGDRILTMYVDGLAESGFFANDAKIGVISQGEARKAVAPIVEKQLGEHDLDITAWGEVAGDNSNLPSIIKDFKRRGITHVLTAGYSPNGFMSAAQSQRYRPLYGLSSEMLPALLQRTVAPTQLTGSKVVGYDPASDVDTKHRPSLGKNQRLCDSIMKARRLAPNAAAHHYCDSFFALKRALDDAGTPTPAALRKAYEAIGSWDSSVTFRADLSAKRHDGGAGYRIARYVRDDAKSGHFEYTGAVHPY